MTCCPSSRKETHRAGDQKNSVFDARSSAPNTRDLAIRIPGAISAIGTYTPHIASDGESPRRKKKVQSFSMEATTVTNERFRTFADATGYVSDAEQFGWSYVFFDLLRSPNQWPSEDGVPSWWKRVEGAFWRRPEGPDSSIEHRLDHPATHISWNDAAAFASWVGGRLPTELEWEHAARGGSPDAKFPWGERDPDDEFTPCNIWQGEFPLHNNLADGFLGPAPVKSFEPNPLGFYNMSGNVWEWCSDAFLVRSLLREARLRNELSRNEDERVLKGGSYLCHKSYCYRYRIAARSGRSKDTSAGHTGFRVAYD